MGVVWTWPSPPTAESQLVPFSLVISLTTYLTQTRVPLLVGGGVWGVA